MGLGRAWVSETLTGPLRLGWCSPGGDTGTLTLLTGPQSSVGAISPGRGTQGTPLTWLAFGRRTYGSRPPQTGLPSPLGEDIGTPLTGLGHLCHPLGGDPGTPVTGLPSRGRGHRDPDTSEMGAPWYGGDPWTQAPFDKAVIPRKRTQGPAMCQSVCPQSVSPPLQHQGLVSLKT